MGAGALGVRLQDTLVEALAPQVQHEPVSLNGVYAEVRSLNVDLVQLPAQGNGNLRWHPACPAVQQEPITIHGAEVSPGRDVPFSEVDFDAQGLQRAAADEILQGVVAEEGQVAGAASWRHAGKDRDGQPAGTLVGQRVQVGGVGRLQLREPCFGMAQASQAVHHQHDDLGWGGLDVFPEDIQVNHGSPSAMLGCGVGIESC